MRARIKILTALNRPVEDWGKLLGDSAAVTAMLDRLLHHGHVLKCARAAGELRPTSAERPNDKTKAIRKPSKNRPATWRFVIQEPPQQSITKRMWVPPIRSPAVHSFSQVGFSIRALSVPK